MNYFKDKNTNEVYAYDQEQIDGGWVKEGLVAMTEVEVSAHLNPPPPTPPVVPEQVSRAQGKAVLITAGLWPDVLACVEAMADPTERVLAEVALNDTAHWRRDSPTMRAISTAIDIASEQMDELFIQASKIEL